MNDAVFTRTHALANGLRVQLRLARRRDEAEVARLLAGRGVEACELELRRLLAFDPARRLVLCAFAPLEGTQTLVGIGAIDLAGDGAPDTLVVDERTTDGLGTLLGHVLTSRARARARRVA